MRVKLATFEARRQSLQKEIEALREVYNRNGFGAETTDTAASPTLLLTEQKHLSKLQRALFVLDASAAIDRVTSIKSKITSLREIADTEAANLANAERAVESRGRSTQAPKLLRIKF